MTIIEVFSIGVLLGIIPMAGYIAKNKFDAITIKFDNAQIEMKDSTEKLCTLHKNAMKNYDEQNKKIEKLQTELALLKTAAPNISHFKKPGNL
jgi:hypothetical protein